MLLDFLPAALRLSLFPTLFAFGTLAPFALRVILGVLVIRESSSLRRAPYRSLRWSGRLMILFSLFLIVGYLTQLAAILLALVAIYLLYRQGRLAPLHPLERYYRVLQIVVLAALIFLGPGAWAVDLPL